MFACVRSVRPNGSTIRNPIYTKRRVISRAVGLVNAVYATGSQMLESVMSIAREIATKSPLAVASTKHLLNYGRDHGIRETLDYQTLWMGAQSPGDDVQRYFLAKADGTDPEYADLPAKDGI